jgi:hypothetical protein
LAFLHNIGVSTRDGLIQEINRLRNENQFSKAKPAVLNLFTLMTTLKANEDTSNFTTLIKGVPQDTSLSRYIPELKRNFILQSISLLDRQKDDMNNLHQRFSFVSKYTLDSLILFGNQEGLFNIQIGSIGNTFIMKPNIKLELSSLSKSILEK